MANPTYDAYGNQFPISPATYRHVNGYGDNAEGTANDITGAEMLAVTNIQLLGALRDDMEEARLRCEDEEDDTSLGEYIAYQAVIERVERFLRSAAGARYDKNRIAQVMQKSTYGNLHYRP